MARILTSGSGIASTVMNASTTVAVAPATHLPTSMTSLTLFRLQRKWVMMKEQKHLEYIPQSTILGYRSKEYERLLILHSRLFRVMMIMSLVPEYEYAQRPVCLILFVILFYFLSLLIFNRY